MISDNWVLWQTRDPDRWQWCLPSDDGRFEYPVQTGSLATAANMIGTQHAVLLIQSEQLLITEAEVQARQAKQIRAALPYLLEEQLATPPEQLHFAYRKGLLPNHYQTVVVDRQLLSDQLSQIAAARIQLTGCYADAQALPLSSNSSTLLIDGDRVLFNSASQRFAAPLVLAETFMTKLNQSGTSMNCCLVQPTKQKPQSETNQLQTARLLERLALTPAQCQPVSMPLELLARGLDPGQATNLLQGPYRKFISRSQNGLPRFTQLLLLILLTLPSAGFWLQHQQHQQELELLTQQINVIHQQQLGIPAPTDRFREQVSQQLVRQTQLKGQTKAVLPITSLLSTFSTIKPEAIDITEINQVNSKLSLTIQAPDLITADELQARMSDADLLGELKIIDRQNDAIAIEITFQYPVEK